MECVIVTYGGGAVLGHILNAVALMTKEGEMATLLHLVLAISGVWVGAFSLAQGTPMVFLKKFVLPTLAVVSLLYTQRTSVMILDEIDPQQKVTKIEGIPWAIGQVGALTSSVMKSLSELLEEKAAPLSGDGLRSTRAGPMFAAHLIARSRDSRVVDPVARQNLKTFVYQCFTWPFVITNLPPGAHHAQEATDLLAFVAAAPHPGLGMYWRDADGGTTFQSCKACVPLVRSLLKVTRPQGVAHLLQDLFPTRPQTETTAALLQTYATQGWKTLTGGSSDVFEAVGQQMLINAYREGLDDHREAFGLTRLDPRLVSHHATRAMAMQNTGFLINGALMARHLPILQNVLFGIFLFLFLLVLPLSLMPGSLRILGTWVKLVVWCQSWPVFYTLLNSVGLMWLQKSLHTMGMGSEGVSILTQNGMADAAWDAYCLVQNLCYTVPFLSWAVLTGSGHALVSLSERMMSASGTSGAASLVDNTYTLDAQQLHTRSVATQQIAQQTLGASLSTAHTVDDGQFRVIQSAGGPMAVQENMSALGTSVSHSDLWQNSFAKAISEGEQATLAHQKTFSEAQSAALSNVSTLMTQWGQGKVSAQDWSAAENAEIRHNLQKLQEAGTRISQSNTANTSTNASLEVQTGAKAGIDFGKIFNFKAGIEGKTGTAALNQEGIDLAKSAGLTSQDIETVNKGVSQTIADRVSTSSDTAQKASNDLRANLDRLQNASDQVSASHVRTQALHQTATFLQSYSATLSRNMIDDVLDYTAERHFGGDKVQAAQYQKTHPQEFGRDVRDFEQGFTTHLVDQVLRGNGPSTSQEIQDTYQHYAAQVKSGVQDLQEDVHQAQHQAGLSEVVPHVHDAWTAGLDRFDQEKTHVEDRLQDHVATTQEAFETLQEKSREDLRSSTLLRTGKEVVRNGEEIFEGGKK